MGHETPGVVKFPSLREANTARQREWVTDGQVLSLSFKGNELAGEVGEACNVIKKLERERLGIAGSRDTVDHLAEELADVVICADLIALAVGIDLDAAVARKFNSTSQKMGLKTRMAIMSNVLMAVRRGPIPVHCVGDPPLRRASRSFDYGEGPKLADMFPEVLKP